MKKSNIIPLLFTLLTFIDVSTGASNVFNVVSFGANPDGVTDSTAAFLKAWQAACGSAASATIMVPTGTFLVKAITFGGPCKSELMFQVAGTVVAPADYRAFRNSGYWILFKKVSKFSLVGGTFDARANGFWACRKSGQSCPPGVRDLIMKNVQNPIIIDQNYCPDHQGCPTEHSGVKISQVTYKNIQGTSATKQAMKLVCSKINPCTGITLQDIKLTYKKKTPATSYCFNALGTSLGVIQPTSCLNR
ncbi:hypothetical protein Bca52824_013454 [Brassica carinata]|uniref:Rhamnogalacturonase A/B/Epimerase-like pectate lyase domain-containing protein n=1 Tax=Brassica carinata TaxID=52824 RepID=A0A8X7VYM4_BRACI|nr:hypothetical protein Bca52824_013454 [Brassica carinata]